MEPQWLSWAKKLRAIAQSGLTYTDSQYEIERYQAVRQVAAEMLAAGSDAGVETVVDLLAGESGYATPKVDVRAAVFRDDDILLVKEAVDGRWTLPGGWADVGEPPSRNIEREVLEESGYQVRATKLAAVYDRSMHVGAPPTATCIYKLFFICEIVGGSATPATRHPK